MTIQKTSNSTTNPTALNGAAPIKSGWRKQMQTIVILFKLRIVFLLLMAATGGAFLAAAGWPGLQAMGLVWIAGGMAAAGASALNQYWERDTDGQMGRTAKRPLVTGEIADPRWVPIVASLLIIVPVIITFTFNRPLAFFLLLGAIIYVGIYTIWLKPRTLLNIVIGGAAGSAAVLTGSAAVGNWNDPGALILSLLLFLWTPFHFWSLALLYRDEYAQSDIPMLPVHSTPKQAAWWVMLHTLPTAVFSILMVSLPTLGIIYLIPVTLVSADLIWKNVKLIKDPSPPNARAVFMASNIYLMVLLCAIYIGTMVRAWWG